MNNNTYEFVRDVESSPVVCDICVESQNDCVHQNVTSDGATTCKVPTKAF